MTIFSPAKINLYLRIVGKRPDGYHELETVMLPLDFGDQIALQSRKTGITLACDDPRLPTDDSNLAVRAAKVMAEAFGTDRGAKIGLKKRTPLAAGLGGGSSNAAATLLGLDRLWKLNTPSEKLHTLAASLGSDINFFMAGGAALCRGRGEKIEPVPCKLSGAILLVNPGFGISTKWAYESWAKAAPESRLTGPPPEVSLLLRALAEIPGVARLRYTTSHPRDMDAALIAAHRDLPMLMPFLHLPVQSGSDRVLAAMHRRHSAADYLRLIERLRAARPDLALSSDFIVGHPGETAADFAATLALVRAVGFAQAFSFKYSRRPGTPAADAPGQVVEAEKDQRLYELQALLREQQGRFNAGCVGLTLPVLFTGPGRHRGQVVGRSPFLQPVHMTGPAHLIGREVPVHIAAAHTNSLAATSLAATSLAATSLAATPIEERARA